MALLFMDGFDNYATITDFWDFAGLDCTIRQNLGNSRTGIGCLQINSAAFGPYKTFGHITHLLAHIAWNSNAGGYVFHFATAGGGNDCDLSVGGNGALILSQHDGGPILVQSVPGVVVFNSYNSIAVEIENFSNLLPGIATAWVNGVQVFHATGLYTGNGSGNPAFNYCDLIQLMGPGGIPVCFVDDFYLLDCSTPPHTTFLGPLKLYALPPTANGAVAWAPLAGTNWSEVNEVPPDGDTSYVSSPNVGDIDQYSYPLTGPPAGSSILMVQHELDMKVDAGARSVASDVAGAVATPVALTNGYHIYPTPYDVNPATGLAWAAGDFPLLAGPKVTA